jgi:hypothetical protein
MNGSRRVTQQWLGWVDDFDFGHDLQGSIEMQIELSLKFAVDTDIYEVSLQVPSSVSKTTPFKFDVAHTPGGKDPEHLLVVNVGDESNYEATVEVPESLLEKIKISQYVKDLSVSIKDGTATDPKETLELPESTEEQSESDAKTEDVSPATEQQ